MSPEASRQLILSGELLLIAACLARRLSLLLICARSWPVVSRLLAGIAATALSLSVGAASASISPGRLVSSALAKAHAQRSVHYVSSQASSGMAVTIAGDAATDRGIQHITYRKARHVGHVTVLVVATTAYLRGDEFTLANYMRWPASAAAAWAGKWLSLVQSAPDYAAVAAAVRLGSTLDELQMPPPFRNVGTSTQQGHRVVGIESHFRRAGHAVSETLYIDAVRSLPVEQVGTSEGITLRAAFSRWNEPVAVSPPPSAIPIR